MNQAKLGPRMDINLDADLNSTLEAMQESDLCIVKQYRKLQADYDLLKIEKQELEAQICRFRSARQETVTRVKCVLGLFTHFERKNLLVTRQTKDAVFTLNRILEKNIDENEPLLQSGSTTDDQIPTYLAKLRAERNNRDSAWQRKYKEMQLNAETEKRNLKRRLEIVEQQNAEAEQTIVEVKAKRARLDEDQGKFDSVKTALENKAEEGVRMVKVKKEAVEKFNENMMEREEKLSKERRNFTVEKRKLKEKIKATLLSQDPDWTPPGTSTSNSRPSTSLTQSTPLALPRLEPTNPSIPLTLPPASSAADTTSAESAEIKTEEIKIEATPVRDPDFGSNPLRTRPILDRGAKRRFSEIIILD